MPAASTVDAVLDVADAHLNRVARGVERLLLELRAAVPRDRLVSVLSAGGVADVDRLVPWEDVFVVPSLVRKSMGDEMQERFLRVMVDAASVGGVHPELFSIVNPHAVAAARGQAADLVVGLRDTTRRTVRQLVTQAVRGRWTVDELASLLSNVVGLDPRRAQALANYQAAVSRVRAGDAPRSILTRAGLRAPGSVSGDAGRRAVERYSQRLTRDRALTVARTEVMRAANVGIHESWRAAASAGLMDLRVVRREWVVTYDDVTCERCAPMGGKVVGFDEPFVASEVLVGGQLQTVPRPETTLTPPLHPRCRCTMILLYDQAVTLPNEATVGAGRQ